jgi:hypothetical protein
MDLRVYYNIANQPHLYQLRKLRQAENISTETTRSTAEHSTTKHAYKLRIPSGITTPSNSKSLQPHISPAMEQLMRRDRSAFNDLIYEHFKNVEEESRKWSESTVELKRGIDRRDARIRELEAELEVVRTENRELSAVEDARRKRTFVHPTKFEGNHIVD